jgi:cell division protein FtsB
MANSLKYPGISGRWIAVATTLFVVAITLAPPLQRYFAQRAQINSLRAEIRDDSSDLAKAQQDLAKWNDPAYVASQARTRLHFVFPGERQYAVLGLTPEQTGSQAPAAPIANQIPSGLPWYGRLLASISTTNVNR